MFGTVRSYATAGVAFIGASVLVATPVAPPPPDVYIANPAVRLTASPIDGLFAAIANIPANEIAALQDLATALQDNGPLQCYPSCDPNNYLGWEQGFDEEFTKALVLALLPFPGLAGPLAQQFNAILLKELPTNPEACTTIPSPCPDPATLFMSWWTIPPWELITSGMLDPVAAVQAFIASLSEPSTVQPLPSAEEVVTTMQQLASGLLLFVSMPIFNDPSNFVRMIPEFAEFFQRLFTGYATAPPPTAIPTFTPDSVRTFNIDVAPAPPGGDITNNVLTSNQVVSPDTGQGGVAATGTTSAPTNTFGAPETLSQTVSAIVTPDTSQVVNSPSTASSSTRTPNATETASDVMSGGNKVEPGQVGGNNTTSGGGGLNDVVNSVTGQITSTITHVTEGLTGGGSQTGTGSQTGSGGTTGGSGE